MLDGVIALALAALALSGCPHDASLGSVRFERAGKTHEVSLATCADRVQGKARPVRRPPVRDSRYVATVRASGHGTTAKQTLWVTDLRTRRSRPVFSARRADVVVPLHVGGGHVFFAIDPDGSASIAADGLILRELPVTGGPAHALGVMLPYRDYLTWCGDRLVWIEGNDRIAVHAKRVVTAGPPDWKARPLWRDSSLSFSTPACPPDGRSVAVLSQRSSLDANFFHTRWQLWRVGLDGSRRLLDAPPPGWADESPQWSSDGRSLLFGRERNGYGGLMLWRNGKVIGPFANLGYSLGFYGHHDWEVAWSA
jgi:hypothetical protein